MCTILGASRVTLSVTPCVSGIEPWPGGDERRLTNEAMKKKNPLWKHPEGVLGGGAGET